MIVAHQGRTDFTIINKLRGIKLPRDSLLKPFSSGVSNLSSYLNSEVIDRSRSAFNRLKIATVPFTANNLYENAPKRTVKQVIESNSALLELASKASAYIDEDAFASAKRPSLGDSLQWVQSYATEFKPGTPTTYNDGPMAYYHPSVRDMMRACGWGCSDPIAYKSVAALLNMIKADYYMPKDITDEFLTSLLFSPSIASYPDRAADAVMALGCTTSTAARVVAFFNSDVLKSSALMTAATSSFSLNTPMLAYIDKSYANLSRHVNGYALTKASKAGLPAMFMVWFAEYLRTGTYKVLDYTGTKDTETKILGVDVFSILQYELLFDDRRKFNETHVHKS